MLIIFTLTSGKQVYLQGKSITIEEAHEIIVSLTGTWGTDFEKAELCDMALGIHAASKENVPC